jgi:hypothetical protein
LESSQHRSACHFRHELAGETSKFVEEGAAS